MDIRRGPQVEIKRGSWEERLREIDREARAELAKAAAPPPSKNFLEDGPSGPSPSSFRWVLIIEPGDGASPLVAAVKPILGEDVLTLLGKEAPVKVGALLPRLLEAHAQEPLVGVAVVGKGDRADAKEAGWKLGPLALRPWVFLHADPTSDLVPTIGEKVVRFMDVIGGIAFMEGPKASRR